MKKFVFISLLFSLSLSAQVERAQKLIVTVSPDWDSNEGMLFLFDATDDGWKPAGVPATVHFGSEGMAWGLGLRPHPKDPMEKKEGDRRSPAGMFTPGLLYGFDPEPPEGVRYPYLPLTEWTRCIDDDSSAFYNRVIEEDTVVRDWSSAEEMRNIQPDYKYVLLVNHNPSNGTGKGSCIFFHINNVPTSGCTSMDASAMLDLLRWLDPAASTVIVQLPKPEYLRLQSEWNLPALTDLNP